MDKKIKKSELTGFRQPKETEVLLIRGKIEKKLNKNRFLLKMIQVFFFCIEISLLYSIYNQIRNKMLDNEFYVVVIILILLCMLTVLINKHIIINKLYLKAIKKNDFQVIECSAYDVKLTDDTGKTMACVYVNVGNVYLEDKFIINLVANEHWEKMKDKKYILMKCDIKVDSLYELYLL